MMLKRFSLAWLFALSLISVAHAQVPHLITYQGRVSSGGAAFNGTGQFKFALTSAGGTPVFWRNDGNNNAPGEPSVSVAVPVTNGLFTVMLGDTALPGMAAIPPGVFNNSTVYLRIWFNDGVNGFAQLSPGQRIAAVGYALMADNVRDGAITMNKIAAGAIDASKLAPGAAVSNLLGSGQSGVGVGGVILSEQADNPNLAAAGYVRIGQADLVSESWKMESNGPPRTLPRPLARSRHTAVWTGTEMIIWGGRSEAGLENTGARYNPALNNWTSIITTNAPVARIGHSAVWTGSEMIVYGGGVMPPFFSSLIITTNTGGRYHVASDSWTALPSPGGGNRRDHAAAWNGTFMTVWGGTFTGSGVLGGNQEYARTGGARYHLASNAWFSVSTTDEPGARYEPSYVWTGSELIVWGGYVVLGSFITTRSNLNTGARYSPAANTWTVMTTNGAASPRYGHAAVHSGGQMVVWGGAESDGFDAHTLNSGGRYNIAANTWSAMTTSGAPFGRTGHTAVWDGNRMIVWGGTDGTNYFATGGRYFAGNNTWSNLNVVGAPAGRAGHRAVWTTTEMIVWGGANQDVLLDVGGRYYPASDSWLPAAPSGESVRRAHHTAVWTGSEMIVWGGFDGETYLNNGGRFNPTLNSWTALPLMGAPDGRHLHTAVWTGNDMVVWGGFNGSILNTGGRYNPADNLWSATTTNNAPLPRFGHTAVWDDTRMIVWGGAGNAFLNTGGRYNPTTDAWLGLTTSGAPAPRSSHTAVWTGDEMIVWGGTGGTIASPVPLATGGRYRPASNSWAVVPAIGAPTARSGHKAVWTGNAMLVWGGGFGTNYERTGGSYNLTGWSGLATNNAPTPRTGHTAVWDGTHMIVWGGTPDSFIYGRGGRYNPLQDTWSATLVDTNTPTLRAFHTAVWAGTEMIINGGVDGTLYMDSTASYVPPRSMFLYLKP
jgi:N-acetylneuraminic acid mutarotase